MQLDLPGFGQHRDSTRQLDLLRAFISGLRRRLQPERIRELFCLMLLLEWANERSNSRHNDLRQHDSTLEAQLFDTLALQLNPAAWDDPSTTRLTKGLAQLAVALHAATQAAAPVVAVCLQVLAKTIAKIGTVRPTDVEYTSYILSIGPHEEATPDRLLKLFDAIGDTLAQTKQWSFTSPPWVEQLVRDVVGSNSTSQSVSPSLSPDQLLTLISEHAISLAVRNGAGQGALPYNPLRHEHEFLVGLTRLVLREHANAATSDLDTKKFDLVISNPPFGATVARELRRRSESPVDVLNPEDFFVEKALERLSPGGRTAIIVPVGFLTRDSARELRGRVITGGHLETVISLPQRVFPNATNVMAAILVLNKPKDVNARGSDTATHVQFIDGSGLLPRPKKRRRGTVDPTLDPHIDVKRAPGASVLQLSYGISSRAGTDPASTLPCDSWLVPATELQADKWRLHLRRRENDKPSWSHSELGGMLENRGEISSLSECATIAVGLYVAAKKLSEAPVHDAIGYLRISDLAGGRASNPKLWIAEDLAGIQQHILSPGEVLLSRSGTVDKAAIVDSELAPTIAGGGIYVIHVDDKRLHSDFLVAYFHSASCRDWLKNHSQRSLYPNSRIDTLSKLDVPLPSLALQVELAAKVAGSGADLLSCLARALGTSLAPKLQRTATND